MSIFANFVTFGNLLTRRVRDCGKVVLSMAKIRKPLSGPVDVNFVYKYFYGFAQGPLKCHKLW